MSRPRISLRPARATDENLLLAWVNAGDSLAQKLRTVEPVSPDAHAQWFSRILKDGSSSLSIIEADGEPVGQVRISGSDSSNEIDIYVISSARLHGIAREALAAAIERWRTAHPGSRITARVLPSNAASRALFESLGFSMQSAALDHLVYTK
jgi:RimJ/RimL family protein N-acetyltransferase